MSNQRLHGRRQTIDVRDDRHVIVNDGETFDLRVDSYELRQRGNLQKISDEVALPHSEQVFLSSSTFRSQRWQCV